MTIYVYVLPKERSVDDGVADRDFNLQEDFSLKLENLSFSNSQWWNCIGGDKFNDVPKLECLGKQYDVYKARINDKWRAAYVTHKDQANREFLIVIGIFDHNYSTYPLANNAQAARAFQVKLQIDIENIERSASSSAHKNGAGGGASASQALVEERNPKKLVLSDTQQELIKHLDSEHVICFGPGGAGKTTVLIDVLSKKDAHIKVLYLGPTPALCAAVKNGLSEAEPPADFTENNQPGLYLFTPDKMASYIVEKLPHDTALPQIDDRHPADFLYFEKWFQDKYMNDTNVQNSRYHHLNSGIQKLLPHSIYAEMTRTILAGHILSSEAYTQTESDDQAEKRLLIYHVYQAYMTHLNRSNYYDPHTYLCNVLSHLQALPKDQLAEIQVDAIRLDEIQRLPRAAVEIAIHLLKNPNIPGSILCVGDGYQDLLPREKSISQDFAERFARHNIPHFSRPFVLPESFRCSKAIGNCANSLIAAIESETGSYNRSETFAFVVNEHNDVGSIAYQTYQSGMPKQYRQDAGIMVIIPDEMELKYAQGKWTGCIVAHISAVVGLEKDRIILFGFGDTYRDVLRKMDWKTNTIKYSRTSKGQTLNTVQLKTRMVLSALYSAITRTRQTLLMIDEKDNIALRSLCTMSIKNTAPENVAGGGAAAAMDENIVILPQLEPATQPTATPTATVSTPLEYLSAIRDFLLQNTQELQNIAIAYLYSTRIWGNKDLHYGKLMLDRHRFTSLNLEEKLAVINEVEQIICSTDIRKTLTDRCNELPLTDSEQQEKKKAHERIRGNLIEECQVKNDLFKKSLYRYQYKHTKDVIALKRELTFAQDFAGKIKANGYYNATISHRAIAIFTQLLSIKAEGITEKRLKSLINEWLDELIKHNARQNINFEGESITESLIGNAIFHYCICLINSDSHEELDAIIEKGHRALKCIYDYRHHNANEEVSFEMQETYHCVLYMINSSIIYVKIRLDDTNLLHLYNNALGAHQAFIDWINSDVVQRKNPGRDLVYYLQNDTSNQIFVRYAVCIYTCLGCLHQNNNHEEAYQLGNDFFINYKKVYEGRNLRIERKNRIFPLIAKIYEILAEVYFILSTTKNALNFDKEELVRSSTEIYRLPALSYSDEPFFTYEHQRQMLLYCMKMTRNYYVIKNYSKVFETATCVLELCEKRHFLDEHFDSQVLLCGMEYIEHTQVYRSTLEYVERSLNDIKEMQIEDHEIEKIGIPLISSFNLWQSQASRWTAEWYDHSKKTPKDGYTQAQQCVLNDYKDLLNKINEIYFSIVQNMQQLGKWDQMSNMVHEQRSDESRTMMDSNGTFRIIDLARQNELPHQPNTKNGLGLFHAPPPSSGGAGGGAAAAAPGKK